MRVQSALLILLVLALVASSCGGDDGSAFVTTTAAQGESLLAAEVLEVSEAITASLGAEPGLLAVGFALDRGYTAGQIGSGGRAGTLRADGWITGVVPALPHWGIFADLPETGGSGAGGRAEPLRSVLVRTDEPNPYQPPITAEQYLRSFREDFLPLWLGEQPVAAEDPGTALSSQFIGIIISLADTGYSPEQILLGIVAGEVVLAAVPSGMGPAPCWFLADNENRLIPAAGPAGEAFLLTPHCRNVLDREMEAGDQSTTTTPADATTTTEATTTSAPGSALYIGSAAFVGATTAVVYEIVDSTVELEVSADAVDATVEYTQRSAIRERGLDEALCVATVTYTWQGRGPVTDPVSLQMEPLSQDILSIEGPECGTGGSGGLEVTAEEFLRANWANAQPQPLTGSIIGDIFKGTLGEGLAVTATRANG